MTACPVAGCVQQIFGSMVLCSDHWEAASQDIRELARREYERGPRTMGHLEAVRQVVGGAMHEETILATMRENMGGEAHQPEAREITDAALAAFLVPHDGYHAALSAARCSRCALVTVARVPPESSDVDWWVQGWNRVTIGSDHLWLCPGCAVASRDFMRGEDVPS